MVSQRIHRAISLFLIAIMLLLFYGCSRRYKKGTPATMRAYSIKGKRYYPTYVKLGQQMGGVSSWYGPNFHSKMTSNGERYNMYAKTAAHKTWPMNTMVKVTNLQNGKSTIVRINDRGPFVRGRIIDCSYSAGKEIGLHHRGIAKVKIEVLGFNGKIYTPQSIQSLPQAQQKVMLTNFGIQVGAFRRIEGANIYKQRYSALDMNHKAVIKYHHDEEGIPLYRVWLMGFVTEDEAIDFSTEQGLTEAFVVRE